MPIAETEPIEIPAMTPGLSPDEVVLIPDEVVLLPEGLVGRVELRVARVELRVAGVELRGLVEVVSLLFDIPKVGVDSSGLILPSAPIRQLY
jgi:hypothetical protein